MKLTAKNVETLKPPATGRHEFWDQMLPGFGVRITDTGRRSYVVMYRHNGTKRRLTLGSVGKLDLAEARDLARKAMAEAAAGRDPAAEKQAQIQAEAKAATPAVTFRMVVETFYTKDAALRTKGWRETMRVVLANTTDWHDRPVDDLTRTDVRALLDGIIERGSPVMANRLLSYLKRVFRYAADEGLIQGNPAGSIAKPVKEQARDRVLSDKEVVEVWHATEAVGYPFGPLFRLALLTAQRRGEVAAAEWSEIDLERAVWSLPRTKTKNGRASDVPLSSLALATVEALPRFRRCPLLFPARTKAQASDGEWSPRPVSGWSRAKDRLIGTINEARAARGQATIEDFNIHDLRRTAASGMARLGVPPHVVEKLLNHAEGEISGVAAIYNRYSYEGEKREALERWSRHIETLLAEGGA
jgi:integrase